MRKYDQVSNLLRKRIVNGDYTLSGLPADRQLAEECGISYMTARRAVQELIDEGLIARGVNGRATPLMKRGDGSRVTQIAFLAPSWAASNFDTWRNTIEDKAAVIGATVRPVSFRHWDDPIIADAMNAFDGVFLLPSGEPIPSTTLDLIKRSRRAIAFLEEDHSAHGIPSIEMIPMTFVHRLLDHLEANGHKRIACINVQPHNAITEGRIEQWRVWMAAHGYEGRLIDDPVESYTDPLPKAYEALKAAIANGKLDASAIVGITDAAAIGSMRALYEAGIEPGRDVAVVTIGPAGIGRYIIPSLTALELGDPSPYVAICLKWMASGGGPWTGSLRLRPLEPSLIIRESSSRKMDPTLETDWRSPG